MGNLWFAFGLTAFAGLSTGIAIAIAIALHNIPEGISVSGPIYFATGNRRRVFTYSLLSGLTEPVGAMIGYLALRLFLGPGVRGRRSRPAGWFLPGSPGP